MDDRRSESAELIGRKEERAPIDALLLADNSSRAGENRFLLVYVPKDT